MIDEIFLVQSSKESRYYESRRALAKAAVEGYLDAKNRREAPVVVRFQRIPGKVANSDIGPGIRTYLEDLPSYVMAKSHERTSIVDAMEKRINELLD